MALVVGAIVHREALQVVEVDVSLRDHAALLVKALFNRLLRGKIFNSRPELELLVDVVGEVGHLVGKFDLLLAAWAVEVAERDA